MIDPSTAKKDMQQPEEAASSPKAAAAPAAAAAASPAPAPTPSSSRRRKKAKQQAPPTKDMIPLHPHFQPGKLDVICSRGKFAYNSPGNCWFRLMVEEQMDNYANARTKTDKSLVVSILVNRVRHANPGGGFVKNYGGRWYRVSDRYSREKVGQQFRDLLHTKYRSSTKAKAEKRKRQQNGEQSPEHESTYTDEDTSAKSTQQRLTVAHSSPRHSPAGSTMSMADASQEDIESKMPALDFSAAGRTPSRPGRTAASLSLQPRFQHPRSAPTVAAVAASSGRRPDMGEDQPNASSKTAKMPPLEEGNMDLEYLDDLEPLDFNGGGNSKARASRSNSLNLLTSGLQDTFPNIFNPPDLHQSLPTGSLEFYKPNGSGEHSNGNNNINNNEEDDNANGNDAQQQHPDDPSDPFNRHWHMSI